MAETPNAYWLWVKRPDGKEERFTTCPPYGLGMFQSEPSEWKTYLESLGLQCRIEGFEADYDRR